MANKDIKGAYFNPDKYVRNKAGYDQLDYSDVTHGDREGVLDDKPARHHLGHRTTLGKGQVPGGGVRYTDLKPEQYLPH